MRQHPLPRWRAYTSYFLAMLFLAYEMGLQVAPGILGHDLMRTLHLNAHGLAMLTSYYYYAYTGMQIPTGLLLDRYNTKVLLCSSILLCAVGTHLFQAPTFQLVILGRVLTGIGSAFAFVGVLFIAAHDLPKKYFALWVGLAQFLAALGAFLGEGPLSHVMHQLGFEKTFTLLTWFGVSLAVLIAFVIRSPLAHRHPKQPIDFVQKMLSILKKRQTWFLALYAFGNWAPMTLFAALWSVPYLMSRYPITTLHAASLTGMMWIGLILGSPLLGWLSDQSKKRVQPMRWSAAFGLFASALLLYAPIPLQYVSALLFLIGVACSGQILSFACVKELNRKDTIATAIGFNNMAVVAAGALLQPLIGYWLVKHWHHKILAGAPFYQASNYQQALSLIPLCFLLSWIICFWIKESTTTGQKNLTNE